MKLKLSSLACGLALASVSLAASAHFLVIYTPQTALLRGADLPFTIVFTHAFAGTPSMAMEKPQRFYYARKPVAGERGEEVDLMQYMEPVAWNTEETTVSAWKANIPRSEMRSL